MHGCMGSKETFTDLLRERGIDTVFRTNDEGRIYGVTFIDHNNKEVYNGSRLGKEFSANVFEKLFRSPEDAVLPQAPLFGEDMQSLRYGDMESSIEQAFGMFSFDTNGPDAQEEASRECYRRRKRKNAVHAASHNPIIHSIKTIQLCNKKTTFADWPRQWSSCGRIHPVFSDSCVLVLLSGILRHGYLHRNCG